MQHPATTCVPEGPVLALALGSSCSGLLVQVSISKKAAPCVALRSAAHKEKNDAGAVVRFGAQRSSQGLQFLRTMGVVMRTRSVAI